MEACTIYALVSGALTHTVSGVLEACSSSLFLSPLPPSSLLPLIVLSFIRVAFTVRLLPIHPLVDGHLDCLHVIHIMNNAGLNIIYSFKKFLLIYIGYV